MPVVFPRCRQDPKFGHFTFVVLLTECGIEMYLLRAARAARCRRQQHHKTRISLDKKRKNDRSARAAHILAEIFIVLGILQRREFTTT